MYRKCNNAHYYVWSNLTTTLLMLIIKKKKRITLYWWWWWWWLLWKGMMRKKKKTNFWPWPRPMFGQFKNILCKTEKEEWMECKIMQNQVDRIVEDRIGFCPVSPSRTIKIKYRLNWLSNYEVLTWSRNTLCFQSVFLLSDNRTLSQDISTFTRQQPLLIYFNNIYDNQGHLIPTSRQNDNGLKYWIFQSKPWFHTHTHTHNPFTHTNHLNSPTLNCILQKEW